MLSVSPENKVHYCSFCNTAKLTSRGLQGCLKCKRKSIRKALLIKQPFTGRCYLGITEIIKPIFNENIPFAIIYIGNILLETDEQVIKLQIEKMSQITRVRKELLYAELITVERINSSKLREYHEIAEIIASCIEMYLAGPFKSKSKQLSQNKTEMKHWVVIQTLDYIHQFYYTDIKLSQIASLYFINEQYLCKLFSKQMGQSFTNYLNEIRIHHAKELLTSSNRKIIEISTMVGFNNVTYFNSVFKEYTHLTPREFRKENH
jgi:YesN/AraC family two-component response regulator